MYQIEHTGWRGEHTGYHVSDYFAAAGVDAAATYATEHAALEATLLVAVPDQYGVEPILSVVEVE